MILNVMQLAHKLFKGRNISQWSYALKLAWALCKRATIKIVDQTIVYTVVKALRKLKVFMDVLERKGRVFTINNNEYDFNLFNYELQNQTI